MGASRKDEFFCRPVRTSLASAIDFWLALKMTLEGKDEKNVFFFILREKEIRRLTSNQYKNVRKIIRLCEGRGWVFAKHQYDGTDPE